MLIVSNYLRKSLTVLVGLYFCISCKNPKTEYKHPPLEQITIQNLLKARFSIDYRPNQAYYCEFDSAGIVWLHTKNRYKVTLPWEDEYSDTNGIYRFKTAVHQNVMFTILKEEEIDNLKQIRDEKWKTVLNHRDDSDTVLTTSLKPHENLQMIFEGYWAFSQKATGGKFTSFIIKKDSSSYLLIDYFTIAPHLPEIADSLHSSIITSLTSHKFYQSGKKD